MYVCVGALKVEVSPSPNFQYQLLGFGIVLSTKINEGEQYGVVSISKST